MSGGKTGLVVFAHGSPVESANEAVREICRRVSDAGGYLVEAAFLERGTPTLEGAVDRLAENGVERVIVVPYFLTLGLHLQRDLPELVNQVSARHPGIRIEATPPLDGHSSLIDILLDRASAAMNGKNE